MRFDEIQADVQTVLNFNPNNADQSFTTAQLKTAINYAYKDIVRKARVEATRAYFIGVQEFTWPAQQLLFLIPTAVRQKSLLKVMDVTDSNVGMPLSIGEGGTITWYDNKTLQWGGGGPPSDRTLRIAFWKEAEPLVNDADEPELVAQEYHELLVWGSAIWMELAAMRQVPPAWKEKYTELELQYLAMIGKGRPFASVNWIAPQEAVMLERAIFQ